MGGARGITAVGSSRVLAVGSLCPRVLAAGSCRLMALATSTLCSLGPCQQNPLPTNNSGSKWVFPYIHPHTQQCTNLEETPTYYHCYSLEEGFVGTAPDCTMSTSP